MGRLVIPNIRIKAGGVLTFQGTAPDQAVYWDLIGHDVDHNPIPALGSLKNDITMTDSSSCATNIYTAPDSINESEHDHITVKAVIV